MPNSTIQFVTPNEVKTAIQINIYPNKCPKYDLIACEILENLPVKAIVILKNLLNKLFSLKYVSRCWKVADIQNLRNFG